MSKDVVRTEAAPAPFQGAPYSQAIKANGFVFVSGQLALRPGDKELTAGEIGPQTEQVFANLRAILEAAGTSLDHLVKTTVFLQNLDDFAGMNEVYAKHVGERPPARSTVEVAKLPVRARSSRSRRSHSSKAVEEYVRSLGLDAYVVGGAVRDALLGRDSKDADFLVPGVDIAGLRAALEPHGRTEELVVAERPVGVRFYPRDSRGAAARARGDRARAAAARGVDRARPPRLRDRRRPDRVGRGRPLSPRLHDQRDGAPARRRRSSSIPTAAQRDLEARDAAHGVADAASPRIRCGSSAGCASSRSSTSIPTPETLEQMRQRGGRRAARLGRADRRRARRRRDGRAVEAAARRASREGARDRPRHRRARRSCCRSSRPRSASTRRAATTAMTVDEHTFAVVQAAADGEAGRSRVRLAALFHDAGKPQVAWRGTDDRLHYYAKPGLLGEEPRAGQRRARRSALTRLRYPTELSPARRPHRARRT